MTATATDALAELRAAGADRGALVGLAIADGTGLALALADGRTWSYGTADPAAVVDRLEHDLRPRWVWWSQDTPALLVRDGVRVATCWDVAAVHRLLFGGWRNDPARAWAATHALDVESIPVARQPDLFD